MNKYKLDVKNIIDLCNEIFSYKSADKSNDKKTEFTEEESHKLEQLKAKFNSDDGENIDFDALKIRKNIDDSYYKIIKKYIEYSSLPESKEVSIILENLEIKLKVLLEDLNNSGIIKNIIIELQSVILCLTKENFSNAEYLNEHLELLRKAEKDVAELIFFFRKFDLFQKNIYDLKLTSYQEKSFDYAKINSDIDNLLTRFSNDVKLQEKDCKKLDARYIELSKKVETVIKYIQLIDEEIKNETDMQNIRRLRSDKLNFNKESSYLTNKLQEINSEREKINRTSEIVKKVTISENDGEKELREKEKYLEDTLYKTKYYDLYKIIKNELYEILSQKQNLLNREKEYKCEEHLKNLVSFLKELDVFLNKKI